MRRKIRRSVTVVLRIGSIIGFIFSAICTFLGAAPNSVISAALGPDIMRHLLHLREGVLSVTAEQARWLLVVQGDLLFGVSLFYLFYVNFRSKISRIYVTQGEHEDSVRKLHRLLEEEKSKFDAKAAAIEASMEKRDALSRQKLAAAKRSERSARKLHNNTYKMLQKIREAKTASPVAKPETSP